MPFPTRPLEKAYPYSLADSFRKPSLKRGGYFYDNFNGPPIMWQNATTVPSFPSAAITQVDRLISPAGNFYHFYQTTEQTILPAFVAGGGWDLGCDQVDNETCELVPGGNDAGSALARVVGTDPNFFIRATIGIATANGSDQMLIGWRKQEAFAVPVSFLTTGDGTYTDFFGIGFASVVAAPNPVSTAYDLNNSGSTTVKAAGFTWANTLIHTLEIRVKARKPKCYINGVMLGGTVVKDALGASITAQVTQTGPDFTFDNGDTLIPFIFVRQDAALTGVFRLYELEIGALRDIGEEPDEE